MIEERWQKVTLETPGCPGPYDVNSELIWVSTRQQAGLGVNPSAQAISGRLIREVISLKKEIIRENSDAS
jgi:hypothetical protein